MGNTPHLFLKIQKDFQISNLQLFIYSHYICLHMIMKLNTFKWIIDKRQNVSIHRYMYFLNFEI